MTAPVIQQQKGEEIAMTAPVLQEQQEGKWVMTFVMPETFTLETIPIPEDPKIQINKVKGKKIAVLRYSGSLGNDAIKTRSKELQDWLNQNGYKSLSSPRSAGYDPPFTIPFLRRNEIHIDVE